MPTLVDLFCGAGGAAAGYYQAGFRVIGVDTVYQPNYPFEFIQADAMTFDLAGFDAIHASPPCQGHSTLWHMGYADGSTAWMLAATIERLEATGLPWIVENVENAQYPSVPHMVKLCGSSFGLRVRRHRKFASNFHIEPLACEHARQGTPLGVYGHGGGGQQTRGYIASRTQARAAMQIHWMRHSELVQAIPSIYTLYIGAQLRHYLDRGQYPWK
jgi:DNA (cytosine-5)-methyltransferase 1